MKIFSFILLFAFCNSYSQQLFKIISTETETEEASYFIVDKNNKVIKELDKSNYIFSPVLNTYGYFAITLKKGGGPGWAAIDINENVLFYVYNVANGEPYPDRLIENKIRIIDQNNKIGFANQNGKIIIEPQFEMASSFHNGKAIIAQKCKKVPWSDKKHEGDCEHYSIECTYHGYIDEKGTILKFGTFSFEEMAQEINWEYVEE